MEPLTNLLNWADALPAWLNLTFAAVGGATVLTLSVPSTHKNPIADLVLRILNVVAGNFHHNKNADAE